MPSEAPRRTRPGVPRQQAGQTPAVHGESRVVLSVGGKTVGELASGAELNIPLTHGAVDIVFVFDTTGSMSDKIRGLTDCLVGLVGDLDRMKLDWRVSCVPFGDLTVPGDRIDSGLPFLTNAAAAIQQLRGLPRFGGGANQGESSGDAMIAALGKPFRQDAVKLLVLLTDDTSLGTQTTAEVGPALTRAEAICFVASIDTQYYRAWSTANGGEWYPIGASMDMTQLRRVLEGLLASVARVASDVHALAGGSVKRYLELGRGR